MLKNTSYPAVLCHFEHGTSPSPLSQLDQYLTTRYPVQGNPDCHVTLNVFFDDKGTTVPSRSCGVLCRDFASLVGDSILEAGSGVTPRKDVIYSSRGLGVVVRPRSYAEAAPL